MPRASQSDSSGSTRPLSTLPVNQHQPPAQQSAKQVALSSSGFGVRPAPLEHGLSSFSASLASAATPSTITGKPLSGVINATNSVSKSGPARQASAPLAQASRSGFKAVSVTHGEGASVPKMGNIMALLTKAPPLVLPMSPQQAVSTSSLPPIPSQQSQQQPFPGPPDAPPILNAMLEDEDVNKGGVSVWLEETINQKLQSDAQHRVLFHPSTRDPLVCSTFTGGSESGGAPPPTAANLKRVRSGSFIETLPPPAPALPTDALSPQDLLSIQEIRAAEGVKSATDSLREAQRILISSGQVSESLRAWLIDAGLKVKQGESVCGGGVGTICSAFSTALHVLSALLGPPSLGTNTSHSVNLPPILTTAQRNGLKEGDALLSYISALQAVEIRVSSETHASNSRNVAQNEAANESHKKALLEGRIPNPLSTTRVSSASGGAFGTASFVTCMASSTSSSSSGESYASGSKNERGAAPLSQATGSIMGKSGEEHHGHSKQHPSTPLRSQPIRRGVDGKLKEQGGGGVPTVAGAGSGGGEKARFADGVEAGATGTDLETMPPLHFSTSAAVSSSAPASLPQPPPFSPHDPPLRQKLKVHSVRFSSHDFSSVRPLPPALALSTLAPPFHPDPDAFEASGVWWDNPELSAASSKIAGDGTGAGSLAFALFDVIEAARRLRNCVGGGEKAAGRPAIAVTQFPLHPPLPGSHEDGGSRDSSGVFPQSGCSSGENSAFVAFTPALLPSTIASAEAMGGASLPAERRAAGGGTSLLPPIGRLQNGGKPLSFHPRHGVSSALVLILSALGSLHSWVDLERALKSLMGGGGVDKPSTAMAPLAPQSPPALPHSIVVSAQPAWNDLRSAAQFHSAELLHIHAPSLLLPFAQRLSTSLFSSIRYHLKRAFNPHVYESYDGDHHTTTPSMAYQPPKDATPGPLGRVGNALSPSRPTSHHQSPTCLASLPTSTTAAAPPRKPLLSRFIPQSSKECGGLGAVGGRLGLVSVPLCTEPLGSFKRARGGLGAHAYIALAPRDSGESAGSDFSAVVHRALRELSEGREEAKVPLTLVGDRLTAHLTSIPIPSFVALVRFSHAHAFLRALFGHARVLEAVRQDGQSWRTLRSLIRFARSTSSETSSDQAPHPAQGLEHLFPLESPATLAVDLEEEGEGADRLGAEATHLFEEYGDILRANLKSQASDRVGMGMVLTGSGSGEAAERGGDGGSGGVIACYSYTRVRDESDYESGGGGGRRAMGSTADKSRPKKRRTTASRLSSPLEFGSDDHPDAPDIYVRPQKLESTLAEMMSGESSNSPVTATPSGNSLLAEDVPGGLPPSLPLLFHQQTNVSSCSSASLDAQEPASSLSSFLSQEGGGLEGFCSVLGGSGDALLPSKMLLLSQLLEHEDLFLGPFKEDQKLQEIGYPTLHLYSTHPLGEQKRPAVRDDAFVSCLKAQSWFKSNAACARGEEGQEMRTGGFILPLSTPYQGMLPPHSPHAPPPSPPSGKNETPATTTSCPLPTHPPQARSSRTVFSFPPALPHNSLAAPPPPSRPAAIAAAPLHPTPLPPLTLKVQGGIDSHCPQCSHPLVGDSSSSSGAPTSASQPLPQFSGLFGGAVSASPARPARVSSFTSHQNTQKPVEGLVLSCECCGQGFHASCVGGGVPRTGVRWKCYTCWGKKQ